MADNPAPYVNIQLGHINNNEKFYIKKGTIVNVNDIDTANSNIKPLTLFNSNKHRVTNWAVMEEDPTYTYNNITKMWTLNGLDNKYESYYIEIPEDALEWIQHMSDLTFEMTINISNDETLKGDGKTSDIASLFNWRNLYEDAIDKKPEWTTAQEYIKLYRGTREYSFGNDYFYKNLDDNKNMKFEEINKIYWRYERETYKDFYPEKQDFDGDFLYPTQDDIRICRGWKKKIISDTNKLDVVKRFVPSNELLEKYNNDWNINNCDRVKTPTGNKIRIKLFSDKNGNVLKKYVFKDIKFSITNHYYTYYKNFQNLQDASVQQTNNILKHWSNINYKYSMFTRKTEKIGNTTIQNAGTKYTNRLSHMQRMWIAFSGGKNLKSNNGDQFFITDIDNQIGRSRVINTISPIQQLLWLSWHLNNVNGSWLYNTFPNYKNGNLNAENVNHFITQILWSWQTLLEILPLSNNNLNTDTEFNELGNKEMNQQTYYNKNFFFEVIKELKGWPIPILKSISEIINEWIPPTFELNINNNKNHIKLLSADVNTVNEAQNIITEDNRLNLFYTIPSNTVFKVDKYLNYEGPYPNNHSMNFTNLIHFVNRLNYQKTGNGWYSKEGFIKKYSIPILGKKDNNTRTDGDKNYMYRISDTPKKNNIRGITRDVIGNENNGTLKKHNGLIIKLPEKYSKYSIPWNTKGYVPKITKIRIELDFAIRQHDENTGLNKFAYSSILSTNYNKPLVYLKSSSRRIIKSHNKDNGWKHSGMLHANSQFSSLDIMNFLNVPKISGNMSKNINKQQEFFDNGRYKIIYEIDNLPVMNPGDSNQIIDPLKSGLLVQIDYNNSDTQKKHRIKTIRGSDFSTENGKEYDGKDGRANYSISPNKVGSIFKDDGPFSFSVHKNDMRGLMSNEETKKHLGFYLFTGEHSSSSYYFKDVKIILDIPELDLENALNEAKGTESLLKISKLEKAIKKADSTYPGVINKDLLLQAKKKLSVMKILIDTTIIDKFLPNQKNIDILNLAINNLINVNINDDDYSRKIELENELEIMKQHLSFQNIKSIKNPTIKSLNFILLEVNNKNIDEKYISIDLITKIKKENIRKISLKDKRNIEKDIEYLTQQRKDLISKYTIDLINFQDNVNKSSFGDGTLGKFISLKNKLQDEEYNKGVLSNINVDNTKLSPISHLKNANDFLSIIKQDWINKLSNKIIDASIKENLYKLIDYVLKSEIEEIQSFKDGNIGLEGKYFEATRKIKNTIDELKLEWSTHTKNNLKKEIWFNWLGDLPPVSSWKGSISFNLYKLKDIIEYIERVVKNLNLKIANDFSLPIKINNIDKGKIIAKDHKIIFPMDPEIYVNKSTQAFRTNWIKNKYIKSFMDDVWIGKTDNAFKKTSNSLGQTDPGKTPLGLIMKNIENNSNSFLKLITIAKNGNPKKDRWHYPGILNSQNIDDSSGTSSYPKLNKNNNGNYLKHKYGLAYPPGPLKKLIDYLEKENGLNEHIYTYRTEKKLYYDNSIWMYEYALKYDTDDLRKINFWIDLSLKHGLPEDNLELIDVKKKLKNFKDNILNSLNKITKDQRDGFLIDDFTNLPILKKEVELATNKFIDDTFGEYLNARQLVYEHEEILKNRIKNVTLNTTINSGLKIIDNIIKIAEDAGFNNYNDQKKDKTGIIDIYNLAVEKRKVIAKEVDGLITNELLRKTFLKQKSLGINTRNITRDIPITEWDIKDINIKSLRTQIEKMERLRGNTKSQLQIDSEMKLRETIEYRNNELNDAIEKSKEKMSLAKDLNNSIKLASDIGLLDTNTFVIKAKNKVNELKTRNLNRLIDVKMTSLNNIGINNNYSNWQKLDNQISQSVDDLIPIDNINIITSKISLNEILSDLNNSISKIKVVIDDAKNLLEKKNTEISVVMIDVSILNLDNQLDIVNKKELLKIDSNLDININTIKELVKTKRRNVFIRQTNGFYYNYNNINILLSNGILNKNIFIENNYIEEIILYFKCKENKTTIGTSFKKITDELLIKNKIFLSINDIIYSPTNEVYVTHDITDTTHNDKDGSIRLKVRSIADKLDFYLDYKCYKYKYQTNKKMNYANNMNGFLFPASSINKKHNYTMNKRNINANIKKMSSGGRQARLQANTGSMSRLQRLKAKNL